MSTTVLVAEDDESIREEVAEILRDEGYEVVTAANGVQTLECLREVTGPAVLILDLMMPKLDGWELRSEQLRDPRLASVPILVVSGAADLREQAAALRADAWLTKPFRVDALIAAVARLANR